MQIRGVDLVMYRVTDMDRSISFYRDTLGLELSMVADSEHWAEFSVAPTTLALLKAENIPYDVGIEIPPFQPGSTAAFLAVDNIENAVKELEEKGVVIAAAPFESSTCWGGVILDPDGNGIHLHQRKDGTAG